MRRFLESQAVRIAAVIAVVAALTGCGDKGVARKPVGQAAATDDPPAASLSVDVKVQKPRPAEWSLRITNLSHKAWTNVVVELVSTAHGAGYVRTLGTVDSGADGERRVACFDCQREDGQRFNPLHMNLRAIRIRCDQGEAEVPAEEEESEEAKIKREREQYFRRQEQTPGPGKRER